MASADTTERQALWQPGGAEEDSCCRASDRYLHLVYDDDDQKKKKKKKNPGNLWVPHLDFSYLWT